MGEIINKYFKNIPKLITQEGGYDMENIGQIVSLFITGLMDKK